MRGVHELGLAIKLYNNIGVSPSPDGVACSVGIVLLDVFAFRFAGNFAVGSIAGKGMGSRA